MKTEFEDKVTGIKRAEHTKRTEISMLYLWMDKYPEQVKVKTKKPINESN